MNIAIIGFGNVGRGLVSILLDKADHLKKHAHFDAKVVAVVTGSNGTLYDPDGLDLQQLLDTAKSGAHPYLDSYPDSPTLHRDWDTNRIAAESNADVIVEASPTDLTTGQPALSVCLTALENGKHVVLANKGPAAVGYGQLQEMAQASGKRLLMEATVMAGTPAIRTATQALAGCTINRVQGILNGTTNYMLTQMADGMDYAAALEQAQELGYAETDPSGDVEGWDAAAKVIILGAVLFGVAWRLGDLDVTGITNITPQDIQSAAGSGECWKLIAEAAPDGGSVRPMRLPLSDPLAGVNRATNAITYRTDLMGDVTLIGAGAGRIETGFAILSDLLDLSRS